MRVESGGTGDRVFWRFHASYTTPDDLAFCDVHGIDLCGPWQANTFTKDRPAVKNPTQIPKTQFTFDEEHNAYRCPQGHLMPFADYKYKPHADGANVRYNLYRCPAEHCQACPLASHCAKLPHKGRTIQRHPQQHLIDKHQERMQTPASRERYRQRGQGERPFADLKTHRALRRLNGRGLKRAETQTTLAVLVHNLETLDSLKKSETAGATPRKPCKLTA